MVLNSNSIETSLHIAVIMLLIFNILYILNKICSTALTTLVRKYITKNHTMCWEYDKSYNQQHAKWIVASLWMKHKGKMSLVNIFIIFWVWLRSTACVYNNVCFFFVADSIKSVVPCAYLHVVKQVMLIRQWAIK